MIYSSALVPSRIKIVHRRYQGKADLLASRMYIFTPADAENPCEGPLRMLKTQKMAVDAFPAFEKYKVIESNPPCGCPMGCVAHCMGGRGFSAVSSPSLNDAFVLRSSLLPTCGFHASFQNWPCHALTPHQVSPLRLGPATFEVPIRGGFCETGACHMLTSSKAVLRQ